jgi:ATP-dependent DNA helicase Q1
MQNSQDWRQHAILRIGYLSQSIAEFEAERSELRSQLSDFEAESGARAASEAPATLKQWASTEKATPIDLKLHTAAKALFGIQVFRPLQLPVMRSLLAGNDTIAVMPTGSGKSLLFQLPALISEGVSIVVSPLRSLMRDQVRQLKAAGVKAEFLCAGQDRSHAPAVYRAMLHSIKSGGTKRPRESGETATSSGAAAPLPLSSDGSLQLKLLFVTPERLAKSKLLKSKLEAAHSAGLLRFIIIDEVHCVSQWGHDFRPDFKQLSVLKTQFPDVACLGLTATAGSQVLSDVQKMLRLKNCQVFRTSVRRPNLFLEVQRKAASASGAFAQVARIVQEAEGGAGIVYCLSRKDAEATTSALIDAGVAAGCYHAWLGDEQREAVHDAWSAGHVQVICATVAFGMGINMLHVRFVVHHSLPKSLEGYSQEAGRAGRDGVPARCVLLYRPEDLFRQSVMVYSEQHGLSKLYAVAKYAQNVGDKDASSKAEGGRHAKLASAFGEDARQVCPFGDAGFDKLGYPLWCGCDLLAPAADARVQEDALHLAAYLAIGVHCCLRNVPECSWATEQAGSPFASSILSLDAPKRDVGNGFTFKQLLTEFQKWDRKQAKLGFKLPQLQAAWTIATGKAMNTTAGVTGAMKPAAKCIGAVLPNETWGELLISLLLQRILVEHFTWSAYCTFSYIAEGGASRLRQLCGGQIQVFSDTCTGQSAGGGTGQPFMKWSSEWQARDGCSWTLQQQATQAIVPIKDDDRAAAARSAAPGVSISSASLGRAGRRVSTACRSACMAAAQSTSTHLNSCDKDIGKTASSLTLALSENVVELLTSDDSSGKSSDNFDP